MVELLELAVAVVEQVVLDELVLVVVFVVDDVDDPEPVV